MNLLQILMIKKVKQLKNINIKAHNMNQNNSSSNENSESEENLKEKIT